MARILEITSYPPPRAGWGVRVEFLKAQLERDGHECVVLNIGTSRRIPSLEYETVMSGVDFARKVWRYSRRGFVAHVHANGDAITGTVLALVGALINLATGRRCILTFHAGVMQRYFPRDRGPWLVPLYWLLFAIPRRIICNSDAVKACITGYGVREQKIVAIPAFSRQYLEFTPAALPREVEAFLQRYPATIFTYVRMRPLFFPLTMIDGMAILARRRRDAGLVICGVSGHMEEALWQEVQDRIREHDLGDRLCIIDDLDHEAFLTMLQRSTVYLRTPITDGVASSVLEALALRVPVVACENGTRPEGVVTYPSTDAEAMASALEDVIARRDEILERLQVCVVPDTVPDEIAVLTSNGRQTAIGRAQCTM